MSMVKFSPIALNFGYDFVLLLIFLGHPEKGKGKRIAHYLSGHQYDHQHDKITILTVVIIPKVVRVVGDRPRNGKSLGRSQIRPAPKFVIPFRPLSPSPPPQLPQMLDT